MVSMVLLCWRISREIFNGRSLESMTPLDRPYHNLAWAYATAGKPERGMALLAEYETIDPALRRAGEPWLHAARGAVQIAAGAMRKR